MKDIINDGGQRACYLRAIMLGKLWRVVISLIYLTGYISVNIHFICDANDSIAEYMQTSSVFIQIRFASRRVDAAFANKQLSKAQNKNAELEFPR